MLIAVFVLAVIAAFLALIFTTISLPLRYPYTAEFLSSCGIEEFSGIKYITPPMRSRLDIIEKKLRSGEPFGIQHLPEPFCKKGLKKQELLNGTPYADYVARTCSVNGNCCNLPDPINFANAQQFIDRIVGCYFSGGKYGIRPNIVTLNSRNYGFSTTVDVSVQGNNTGPIRAYVSKMGCLYLCT